MSHVDGVADNRPRFGRNQRAAAAELPDEHPHPRRSEAHAHESLRSDPAGYGRRSGPARCALGLVASSRCGQDDPARAFDYLLGTWRQLKDGQTLTLHYESIHGGNAILETVLADEANTVISTTIFSYQPASGWTVAQTNRGGDRAIYVGPSGEAGLEQVQFNDRTFDPVRVRTVYRQVSADEFELDWQTRQEDTGWQSRDPVFRIFRVERPEPPKAPGRIAFISNRSENFEIYTMDPDGTEIANLSFDPASDHFAHWIAGGSRVAFLSQRGTEDGSWQRWEVDRDGTDLERVPMPGRLYNQSFGAFPALSPNGSYVVYAEEVNGEQDLYVARYDGGGARLLAPAPGLDYRPRWSPDGPDRATCSWTSRSTATRSCAGDAEVSIRTRSALGGSVVSIHPGTPDGGPAAEGVIDGRSSQGLFDEINDAVAEMRGPMKKTLDNLEKITDDFAERSDSIALNVDEFVKNARDLTDDLKTGKGTLGKLFQDDKLYTDLEAAIASIKQVADDASSGGGPLDVLLHDKQLASDLKETVANARSVTAKLDQGEGALGKLLNDPTLYDDLAATAADLKEITATARSGQGALGKLLYDQELAGRLDRISKDVAQVTGKLRKGEGTLGKLIQDEELYTELRGTLKTLTAGAGDARENAPILTFAGFLFGGF